MQTQDIGWLNLALGMLLLLIPAAIFYYYRTGLVKALAISSLRMVVQLLAVGFYLKYLFEWNKAWINIAWLLLMVGVCTIDLTSRVKMRLSVLAVPVYMSVLTGLAVVAVYFLKVVLGIGHLFDSRYFIPICGILLGNILSSGVIGLNAFYGNLERERQMYNYLICNGASMPEAIRPFIREALIKAFNPTLASMAVMGLISLPGTLIGQIIGGSAPDVAVRYQMMMMVIILASSIVALLLCLLWSVRTTFDAYGRLDDSVFVRKTKS